MCGVHVGNNAAGGPYVVEFQLSTYIPFANDMVSTLLRVRCSPEFQQMEVGSIGSTGFVQ